MTFCETTVISIHLIKGNILELWWRLQISI